MKRAALLLVLALFAIAPAAGCRIASRAPSAQGDLGSLDFREVVQSAKDKVFPAVVYIKAIRETHEAGKKISQEVAGSGVIVSPEGEFLTNWHVVDKAVLFLCDPYDGRAMDAEIVGTDKDTDLAVLRLKRPDAEPVPYAELGDSEVLKEGDFVMAMGAPWGLSRSVSIGIIACTRRFLPERSEYSLWLQTDASISPGNSGGPLVNTDGQVVGINTLAAMMGGDLGFAVPSVTVRYILDQIRNCGKVNWSWTGLQLQPLRDFDRNTYFEGTDGVIVAETDPESPARRAGLLARDRILRIADRPVSALRPEDLPAVRRLIGLLAKGEPVQIAFLRDEQPMTVELTPREKGKVEGEELDCPRWDFTVREINQFDNPDLYFQRKQGVFLYGIKSPGNAANADLRPKDILLAIDGQDVKTLDDVKRLHAEAIANVRQHYRAMISVLRNGLLRQMVLDFSRDYEKE